MEIHIEAEVHPTEDPEKVRAAILNLFPDAEFAAGTTAAKDIRCISRDIQPLMTRIHEQQIRDTARNILLRAVRGGRISFRLNKQAALAGRVNFTEGNSVLGDIDVEILSDNPEGLISSELGGCK